MLVTLHGNDPKISGCYEGQPEIWGQICSTTGRWLARCSKNKGYEKLEIISVNDYGFRSTNVSTFGYLRLVYPNDNVCFEQNLCLCTHIWLPRHPIGWRLHWWCLCLHCRSQVIHCKVLPDIKPSFSAMARESLLGTAVLTGFKAGIFFPFFYHTFLGFRHWSWDIFAVGIRDMATFYNTGYIAIAASLVLTGIFQKLP